MEILGHVQVFRRKCSTDVDKSFKIAEFISIIKLLQLKSNRQILLSESIARP